jgi:hypothetical protein
VSKNLKTNSLGRLAVCDILGSIHVWRLPSNLSSHEPDELDFLLKLNDLLSDSEQNEPDG